MSALRVFADYVHKSSYEDLSVSAVEGAKMRLLDYLGTAFHASGGNAWAPMLKVFRGYGYKGECTVIARDFKLPCAWAAMVNTYPHMSEGSRFAGGHCAWVTMPAALAMAERQAESVTGKDLILSIVMAYEVMLRIGEAIYPGVHENGFQPTTVRGPIGASVAASKLLKLETDVMTDALSIACSMGAGLEAATSPWPLYCFQIGRATEAGIVATLAAAAGLRGKDDILEEGFLKAFGSHTDSGSITANLSGASAIESTYIKVHFGCRHAHSPVDTCLDLMRIHQLGWQDIQQIRVRTYPQALEICNGSGARTTAEAFNDLPTMLALAIVHGDAEMRRFREPIISSQPVQHIRRCIMLQSDYELAPLFPSIWPAIVEVVTVDGRVLTHRRNLPRGEPEEPFGFTEVEGKFHQLASGALSESSRYELVEKIHALEKLDAMADLFEILARSG